MTTDSKTATARPMGKRGQGRKPLPSDQVMKPRQVRMTDEEWAKCMRLGGSAWLRERVRLAREDAAEETLVHEFGEAIVHVLMRSPKLLSTLLIERFPSGLPGASGSVLRPPRRRSGTKTP